MIYAPIAQLDRALDSGSKGHGFDSCWAHHLSLRYEAFFYAYYDIELYNNFAYNKSESIIGRELYIRER